VVQQEVYLFNRSTSSISDTLARLCRICVIASDQGFVAVVNQMEAMHSKSHRSTCCSINEFAFHSARASTFSEEEDEALAAAEIHSEAASEIQLVRLNVGGTSFVTSLGTLTAVPGSFLAALFGSGQWSPSVVPGSQTPFIDRDPER
jgi:hypothetical protein